MGRVCQVLDRMDVEILPRGAMDGGDIDWLVARRGGKSRELLGCMGKLREFADS